MRRATRLLITTALGLPVAAVTAAAGAAWLAWSAQPAVGQPPRVTPADVGRVYELLKRNSPLQGQPGLVRAAVLNDRDIELLVGQASKRLSREVRPKVALAQQTAQVQLSLAAPANPWGGWLNLQATLVQTKGLPQVQGLRIGHLPLPGWVAAWAAAQWLRAHHLEAQSNLALQLVNQVSFAPQMAVVAFAWPTEKQRQAMTESVLPAGNQARLKAYVTHLSRQGRGRPLLGAPGAAGGPVPLSVALPPLFALVQQRLTQGGPDVGSPAEENRAALLALTLAAQPGALFKLVPAARQWPAVAPLNLTLRGREDFPLHFLVSAVIAAEAGGPLADAVGVFKEMADTQGGSGFSFNDIAADRAGARFGQLAVKNPLALQRRLAPGLREDDLLPAVDDLPEFMSEREFAQRFGTVGSPAYRAMLSDIESRLDRLALLNPGALR